MTGCSGFIGSVLKPRLEEKGYEVVDLKQSSIADSGVQYLIHLASLNSIRQSYAQPVQYLEANLIETVKRAEECLKLKDFRQFIFPSSLYCFAKPDNPQTLSKLSAELYLEYLGRVYNFPYTIFRQTNTYGRTANTDYFIEGTISKMLKGEHITLQNPNAVRDWIYVEDVIAAYIKALGNERAKGRKFDICTGKGYSLMETANIMSKLTGYDRAIEWTDENKRLSSQSFFQETTRRQEAYWAGMWNTHWRQG